MKLTLFALLLIFVSGCASKEPVALKRVTQSQTCNSESKVFTIEVIDDNDEWKRLFSQRFAYGELPPPTHPEVDLDDADLVIIDMGERPNSGYSMRLSEDDAILDNGLLKITVTTTSPKEGMAYAQMLSHPCLAITIPEHGYHSIHVIDQNGIVLATLQIPRQRQ